MKLVLNGIWRRKTAPRCVLVVGCTARGGVLVRSCKPDGTYLSAKPRTRLMWPSDFFNYVCLGIRETHSENSGSGEGVREDA